MVSLILAAVRRVRTAWVVFLSRRFMQCGRDIHIGSGCRFWAPVRIRIGKGVYVGKEVTIEANCEIGDFCLLANRVSIVGRRDHDFRQIGVPVRFSKWVGAQDADPNQRLKVVVGQDVWIGFGATVLSGVTIGRGAVIAAGSVVSHDVEPYAVVAGNPARFVKHRFSVSADIAAHEASLIAGEFRFSERGYAYWKVKPVLHVKQRSEG